MSTRQSVKTTIVFDNLSANRKNAKYSMVAPGPNGTFQPVKADPIPMEQFSYARNMKKRRVIGHHDIAAGQLLVDSGRHEEIEYISVPDAIQRERKGENLEIHLRSTEEDDRLLAPYRANSLKTLMSDTQLDYWYMREPRYRRPVPVADPNQPYEPIPESDYEPVSGWIRL